MAKVFDAKEYYLKFSFPELLHLHESTEDLDDREEIEKAMDWQSKMVNDSFDVERDNQCLMN